MSEDTRQPQENPAIVLFVDGMTKAVEQVANVVANIVQQVMPVIQQVYATMEAKYQEVGAPYGDSHEGLMQWMQDIGEINRKQQEIERLLLYHETLVDARKLGEKIRAKQQSLDKEQE